MPRGLLPSIKFFRTVAHSSAPLMPSNGVTRKAIPPLFQQCRIFFTRDLLKRLLAAYLVDKGGGAHKVRSFI